MQVISEEVSNSSVSPINQHSLGRHFFPFSSDVLLITRGAEEDILAGEPYEESIETESHELTSNTLNRFTTLQTLKAMLEESIPVEVDELGGEHFNTIAQDNIKQQLIARKQRLDKAPTVEIDETTNSIRELPTIHNRYINAYGKAIPITIIRQRGNSLTPSLFKNKINALQAGHAVVTVDGTEVKPEKYEVRYPDQISLETVTTNPNPNELMLVALGIIKKLILPVGVHSIYDTQLRRPVDPFALKDGKVDPNFGGYILAVFKNNLDSYGSNQSEIQNFKNSFQTSLFLANDLLDRAYRQAQNLPESKGLLRRLGFGFDKKILEQYVRILNKTTSHMQDNSYINGKIFSGRWIDQFIEITDLSQTIQVEDLVNFYLERIQKAKGQAPSSPNSGYRGVKSSLLQIEQISSLLESKHDPQLTPRDIITLLESEEVNSLNNTQIARILYYINLNLDNNRFDIPINLLSRLELAKKFFEFNINCLKWQFKHQSEIHQPVIYISELARAQIALWGHYAYTLNNNQGLELSTVWVGYPGTTETYPLSYPSLAVSHIVACTKSGFSPYETMTNPSIYFDQTIKMGENLSLPTVFHNASYDRQREEWTFTGDSYLDLPMSNCAINHYHLPHFHPSIHGYPTPQKDEASARTYVEDPENSPGVYQIWGVQNIKENEIMASVFVTPKGSPTLRAMLVVEKNVKLTKEILGRNGGGNLVSII